MENNESHPTPFEWLLFAGKIALEEYEEEAERKRKGKITLEEYEEEAEWKRKGKIMLKEYEEEAERKRKGKITLKEYEEEAEGKRMGKEERKRKYNHLCPSSSSDIMQMSHAKSTIKEYEEEAERKRKRKGKEERKRIYNHLCPSSSDIMQMSHTKSTTELEELPTKRRRTTKRIPRKIPINFSIPPIINSSIPIWIRPYLVDLNANPSRRREPVIQPQMPQELKEAILQMGGCIEECHLVLEKKLTNTDMSEGHGRLSFPRSQLVHLFVTQEEEDAIKTGFLKIMVLDSNHKFTALKFAYWQSLGTYNLFSGWTRLAKNDKFKEHDYIQFWSFRPKPDAHLSYAAVKLVIPVQDE